MNSAAPVVAIDGPAASGKGTVAKRVAQALAFHYLESGSLYRLVGFVALRHALSLADEESLAAAAVGLNVAFDGDVIWLDGEDVAAALRDEAVGRAASRVAVFPRVRTALVLPQRAFRRLPGPGPPKGGTWGPSSFPTPTSRST